MADQSKIEWTDSTFNPWIGCTKVSPACDHCYAAVSTPSRTLGIEWGAGKPRHRTSAEYWQQPLRWNEQAFGECRMCGWRGEMRQCLSVPHPDDGSPVRGCPRCRSVGVDPARRRVFCASLADVFDNEVDPQWRVDLFRLIAATPNLDWLLLTKRIGNAPQMIHDAILGVPEQHGRSWPNVWLGATICNQAEADRDIPKLLATPASVRFLSMEPLLGPVDLRLVNLATEDDGPLDDISDEPLTEAGLGIDWIIAGGESGHGARPMHPDWARSLRDQCKAAGVPFLFKQWGEWAPTTVPCEPWPPAPDPNLILLDGEWQGRVRTSWYMRRVGKKNAGRLLDGIEHNGHPAQHHV